MAMVLALGAAFGWGTADFLGGLKSRTIPLLSVLAVSQGCALAVLVAFTVVRWADAPGLGTLGFAAFAGAAEVVGMAALYRGLAVGTMSIVASVASVAPVVPLLAGMMAGEIPRAVQFVGIGLAMFGLILTSNQPDDQVAADSSAVVSIGYGALAAGGFGTFMFAMDTASHGDVGWALVTARATAVTLIAIVVLATRHRVTVAKPDRPVVALIGFLIVAADAMYATATTLGLLGIVAILGSLHTIVTIGLARLVLREHLHRAQHIGIAVTLGGVLAISAGS